MENNPLFLALEKIGLSMYQCYLLYARDLASWNFHETMIETSFIYGRDRQRGSEQWSLKMHKMVLRHLLRWSTCSHHWGFWSTGNSRCNIVHAFVWDNSISNCEGFYFVTTRVCVLCFSFLLKIYCILNFSSFFHQLSSDNE